MTSPEITSAAASTRTEADVRAAKLRELYKARIRAWDAYQMRGFASVSALTEDERVDIEMESARLRQAWEAACLAVYRFERAESA